MSVKREDENKLNFSSNQNLKKKPIITMKKEGESNENKKDGISSNFALFSKRSRI